jgi:glycosyltransferase involved in cell wall biosynthesis
VLAEKQLGCKIENASVVRNPFNIDYYPAIDWPTSAPETIHFANVARLDFASKGQDVLLETFATETWRARSWRLRLYGSGPQKDVVSRLAHRLNIVDRVSFPGFQSVDTIWASNHVLVMPSRSEGLPLAVVEAMLCARPIVATNVGGHAEVTEDGVTGFLADAPTVASLGAALERCWERRNDLAAMGKAGAEKIRQLVPADPIKIFADEITRIAGSHS